MKIYWFSYCFSDSDEALIPTNSNPHVLPFLTLDSLPTLALSRVQLRSLSAPQDLVWLTPHHSGIISICLLRECSVVSQTCPCPTAHSHHCSLCFSWPLSLRETTLFIICVLPLEMHSLQAKGTDSPLSHCTNLQRLEQCQLQRSLNDYLLKEQGVLVPIDYTEHRLTKICSLWWFEDTKEDLFVQGKEMTMVTEISVTDSLL